MTRLKALRLQKNLTQRQLARELNYRDHTVFSLLENDPYHPRVTNRIRDAVAEFFNLPLEKLFEPVEIAIIDKAS